MYRCQMCGVLVPIKTPCRKLILETRVKIYPARKKAHPGFDHRGGDRFRSNRRSDRMDDYGGTGYETVREVNACETCATLHKPRTE